MQIYVSKSGQRYGPYTVKELRTAVLSNVFRPEDFASCDDGRTWRPISEVPGLGPIAYLVESDTEGSLLAIRYRGRVVAEDVACCADEVEDALAKMPSGFGLLVDLTGLESMDVACVPYLEKIMQLCNAKGVSVVVRIVPDKRRDIGLQIMSHFHYGRDVRIFTCNNLKEASAILARMTNDPAGAVAPDDAQDE